LTTTGDLSKPEDLSPVRFLSKARIILQFVITLVIMNGAVIGTWYWLVNIVGIDSLPSSRIVLACQMLLQLDSFLVGGWIIGFFHFYGEWAKEMRAFRRLWYQLKLQTSKTPSQYFKVEPFERSLGSATTLYLLSSVGGITVFVVAAILAIAGVLSEDGRYTLLSLTNTEIALAGMIFSWYTIQYALSWVQAIMDKFGE